MTVHVINLDRHIDRLRTFMDINQHLPKVERLPAVDGRSVNRQSLRMLGVISEGLHYSDGNLGCALSHIKLWRKALKDDCVLTVAEDDAIFARNFDPAHDLVLKRLPRGWDFVLWGWNFDALLQVELLQGVARSILRSDQEALRRNIGAFRDLDITSLPFRLHHAFGTMCYSVSQTGAKVLLETCLPLSDADIRFGDNETTLHNRSIDSAMNAAYPLMKAFVCIPPLAVSENRRETARMRPDTC